MDDQHAATRRDHPTNRFIVERREPAQIEYCDVMSPLRKRLRGSERFNHRGAPRDDRKIFAAAPQFRAACPFDDSPDRDFAVF